MMRISEKGLNLIRKYEGFRAKAYLCPAGKLTIGYGHVLNKKDGILKITREAAEELLLQDIKKAELVVNKYVRIPLTQGQFDALVSLVFNWGSANFLRSKGLRYLNGCPKKEFFSKEKGVVSVGGKFSRGLYNRRQAELRLWNEA